MPQAAISAMMSLEKHLTRCSLETSLLELVRLRASQLNECSYCIDMHHKDARAAGESEQRLYGLSAWRETPYYDARERAALEWTEAVTLLGSAQIDDAAYARIQTVFSETELADLTFAVIAINGWNRLNVAMQNPAGSYQVGMHDTPAD